jgi:hypothetical protein
MLRVTVYLKSGAVAEFDAEAMMESAEPHPKFRLDFPAAEQGGRRLVYLDRDDVSAVVVEDVEGPRGLARPAETSAMIDLTPLARDGEQDVLRVPAVPAAP